MSGVKKLGATALIVLFVLNSCTDFFTTSWGEMFKRDPKNVKVTASNVYDLLDAAKGDPELSRVILSQIDENSNDTLKRAAIQAANQAANLSGLALENIGEIIDAADKKDANALQNLAKKIQGDLRENDIDGIGTELNAILGTKLREEKLSDKDALIKADAITVSVPLDDNSGGKATVTINVDDNTGVGTVTITTPDGNSTNYPCTVTDDDTIVITRTKPDGTKEEIPIGYTIDEQDRLTLTGLDEIPGVNLKDESEPSKPDAAPSSKPVIEDGFLDSVSEADLTLLVMTLILAKHEKVGGDLDTYFETWKDKDAETGKNLDEDEKLIAAILNVMLARGDDMTELTDMVSKLLGVKK